MKSSAFGQMRPLLSHPCFLAALLLLPAVFLMPPIPIDETRYLAVAWEMYNGRDFLVPHLNGNWYSDKPPLLFWLINLGWLLTGVHAWTGRAVTLLCSMLSAMMLRSLAQRLDVPESGARAAQWVLLGAIYFAIFAIAIMFDVLLTTCVLLCLLGIVDIKTGRLRRGVLVTGVAIGLGILAKGPVMMLDISFVALGAPWWGAGVGIQRGNYFGALGLAVLIGVSIGLAWAIPAAMHGGPHYAHAIFLHQTLDRVSASFAHQRPIWWYLMLLPVMLLPWTLVLRGRWASLRAMAGERAVRFALCWIVPTFIVFSLISGKQPHYLLPIVPGIALLLGAAVGRGALEIRSGLLGLILLFTGFAIAALPFMAAYESSLESFAPMWPWWGIGIALVGGVLIAWRNRWPRVTMPALAMICATMLVELAIRQGFGDRYDIVPIATAIRAAQASGRPIAHIGWHHGLYEFAGRLKQPLPSIEPAEVALWASAHPNGLLVTFYSRYRFHAEPLFRSNYPGGEFRIWSATSVRERAIDAVGVDP